MRSHTWLCLIWQIPLDYSTVLYLQVYYERPQLSGDSIERNARNVRNAADVTERTERHEYTELN